MHAKDVKFEQMLVKATAAMQVRTQTPKIDKEATERAVERRKQEMREEQKRRLNVIELEALLSSRAEDGVGDTTLAESRGVPPELLDKVYRYVRVPTDADRVAPGRTARIAPDNEG